MCLQDEDLCNITFCWTFREPEHMLIETTPKNKTLHAKRGFTVMSILLAGFTPQGQYTDRL